MDTLLEIKKTKELVETILKEDERARNSDKWLTYRVFQHCAEAHGKKIFLPFELFKEFPSFETVRRARQKYQSAGKYPPTSLEVRKKRKIREEVFKAWAVQ